jgi:hypothetical protein
LLLAAVISSVKITLFKFCDMNNAIFVFDYPENEPVKSYSPGTPERRNLQKELDRMSSETMDIPLIIGGKEVRTGNTEPVVMPHDHGHILANYHKAGPEEVKMAIDAALEGPPGVGIIFLCGTRFRYPPHS